MYRATHKHGLKVINDGQMETSGPLKAVYWRNMLLPWRVAPCIIRVTKLHEVECKNGSLWTASALYKTLEAVMCIQVYTYRGVEGILATAIKTKKHLIM